MPTKLLISDANIFIDMEVGGLTKQMFRLKEYEFAVPDVLYETELKDNHSGLPKLGLRRIELQPPAIEETVALGTKYPKPGRIDLMALALAKQEQCPLLTGDHRLREAGIAEGVAVFGTLWLVGEMLRAKIITQKDARSAYAEMKESGRRLPWNEIERQLEK